MLRLVTLAFVAACLAGCADGSPTTDDAAALAVRTAPATADGTEAAAQSADEKGAVAVSEDNDVYTFEYAFPAEAGDIPRLRALLLERMKQVREAHIAMAIDARADADSAAYPFNPYGSSTGWQVVADLPNWLSLSADYWEFTGGAHGNSAFGTLLWDKRADVARDPLSLFTSAAALQGATQAEFCDLLDRQRAQKRGEPVVREEGNWMNECIGLDAVTVVLGSSNRRTFDRIGFLVPPYNAGPYAEGSYEVTLPVGKAIMDAVKPEFKTAFSAVR